jgi:hypothetical protein
LLSASKVWFAVGDLNGIAVWEIENIKVCIYVFFVEYTVSDGGYHEDFYSNSIPK